MYSVCTPYSVGSKSLLLEGPLKVPWIVHGFVAGGNFLNYSVWVIAPRPAAISTIGPPEGPSKRATAVRAACMSSWASRAAQWLRILNRACGRGGSGLFATDKNPGPCSCARMGGRRGKTRSRRRELQYSIIQHHEDIQYHEDASLRLTENTSIHITLRITPFLLKN